MCWSFSNPYPLSDCAGDFPNCSTDELQLHTQGFPMFVQYLFWQKRDWLFAPTLLRMLSFRGNDFLSLTSTCAFFLFSLLLEGGERSFRITPIKKEGHFHNPLCSTLSMSNLVHGIMALRNLKIRSDKGGKYPKKNNCAAKKPAMVSTVVHINST